MPRKKVTPFFLLIVCIKFCVSRVAPTPCFRRVPPPTDSSQPGSSTVWQAHQLALTSPSYAGRSGGPGRAIPAGTLKLPPAPTSLTPDEPENRTIALCNKTGGSCVIQGPKSKTNVLIVLKTYLAYINSIKNLKKHLYEGIC